MSEVFVLGDLNVDALMPVDRFPQAGEDVRSERMLLAAGGSAANSACMLARLGHRSNLLAAVGDDPFSQIARAQLTELGVDLQFVQTIKDHATGLMFVPVTPDGERTLFGRRGANIHYGPAGLPLEQLGRADWLHLSGYALIQPPQAEACKRSVQAAVSGGVPISLDTAYEPPLVEPRAFRALLPQLTLLVLGEQEALALSGASDLPAAMRWLHKQGVPRIALKQGRKGSLLSEAGQCWSVPALPVNTVDSTGAGDGFSGALVCAQLWQLPLHAGGLLASAAAALVTSSWGAAPSTPAPEQIAALLQRTQLPDEHSQAKLLAISALEVNL